VLLYTEYNSYWTTKTIFRILVHGCIPVDTYMTRNQMVSFPPATMACNFATARRHGITVHLTLNYNQYNSNKIVDIEFSAHDAFLE
jgi:hypothetical protein